MDHQLIPYSSPDDLEKKVNQLLGWYSDIDTPTYFPLLYSPFPGSRYPPSGHGSEYWPDQELFALMNNLPQDHEIIQELLKQTRTYLVEMQSKSGESLLRRNPFHLNSLEHVGGHGYETLFDIVKATAEHVLDQYLKMILTTEKKERRKDDTASAAVKAMLGYTQSHPKEVERFMDLAWETKVAVAYTIRGYAEIGSHKSVKKYFELVKRAVQQGQLPYTEVVRGKSVDFFHLSDREDERISIDLKYVGRTIKKAFPDLDITPYCPNLNSAVVQFLQEKVFIR